METEKGKKVAAPGFDPGTSRYPYGMSLARFRLRQAAYVLLLKEFGHVFVHIGICTLSFLVLHGCCRAVAWCGESPQLQGAQHAMTEGVIGHANKGVQSYGS